MCFSATASFVAGGGLTAVGGSIATRARSKRELPLALIPLLFGLQQIVEGVQWVSAKPSSLSLAMGYLFLSFAFVLWPTYVPIAILLVETHPLRKRILSFCVFIGVLVSAFLLGTLLTKPLAIEVLNNHIKYNIELPRIAWGLIPYVLATVGSCLISSHRMIFWLGLGMGVGLAVSLIFYKANFGSVWCFFAAVLSIPIYFHFKLPVPSSGKSRR